uniref:TBC1 domain family member 10B n=1 Tax=Chrysemys picta bellii TaxID=8478 RepID=A0A8C3FJ50_CHRPI
MELCAIPVDVARQRELKWLDMFSHWDKWLSRRFQKVKLRCRKGIPSSLRAKAWQLLSNSKELLEQNPSKFEELERQPGDPKWLDVIEKDLHRQFPFHEMFAARGGHGPFPELDRSWRPLEGKACVPSPEPAGPALGLEPQAFWCLVQICEKYLPGYYSAGLEAIQLDGEIFFALLRRASPMAYRHLKKYKIDPILYMTEWFMCIFSRTLPWASVLRVWDMFFCEGVKIVFRVGLVLLRNALGSVDKLRSCQGMYETMEKLRNLPAQSMQEDFLIQEVSPAPTVLSKGLAGSGCGRETTMAQQGALSRSSQSWPQCGTRGRGRDSAGGALPWQSRLAPTPEGAELQGVSTGSLLAVGAFPSAAVGQGWAKVLARGLRWGIQIVWRAMNAHTIGVGVWARGWG